eukprot:m.774968 g.774968  ORF g.774968 m.774968 type:complete len:922 (+) comp23258_c1_seq5:475-3240(+)
MSDASGNAEGSLPWEDDSSNGHQDQQTHVSSVDTGDITESMIGLRLSGEGNAHPPAAMQPAPHVQVSDIDNGIPASDYHVLDASDPADGQNNAGGAQVSWHQTTNPGDDSLDAHSPVGAQRRPRASSLSMVKGRSKYGTATRTGSGAVVGGGTWITDQSPEHDTGGAAVTMSDTSHLHRSQSRAEGAKPVRFYLQDGDIDMVDGRKSAPTVAGRIPYYDPYYEQALRHRTIARAPLTAIERHKESNNYLFGMKKWKGTLTRRPLEERSETVRSLYAPVLTRYPVDGASGVRRSSLSPYLSVGNVLYVIFFGWWLAAAYLLLGFILWLTLICQDYTHLCWDLASYFLWPFGKYMVRYADPNTAEHHEGMTSSAEEKIPLVGASTAPANDADGSAAESAPEESKVQERRARLRHPGFYIWAVCCVLLWLLHGVVVFFCGFFVVFIPMAKIQWLTMTQLLWYDPKRLRVEESTRDIMGSSEIVMCTYQAVNVYYYKYTIGGMNICLVNLLAFVLLAIFLGEIDRLESLAGKETVFIMSLLSVIPLAYYIGMSIANISAQSTFAVGAVLNASFGSVVELILYYKALTKGLRVLVKASLTGTLLGTMLFIPGICMVIGGLKFEHQYFNLRSAGVSSSLLFVSVAGAYSPSLFQHTFGAHNMVCDDPSGASNCTAGLDGNNTGCQCYWKNLDDEQMEADPVYINKTRKLVVFCSIMLPLAYLVGLIYTLRTHSDHIYKEQKATGGVQENEDDEEEAEDKGGHGHFQHGPIWSNVKAISILLVSTILLAFIAELVVDNITPIIERVGVGEETMGLLVVAMLPDVAEIVNGIQFARQNNIALSIEVGSSLAVQVCLIQMPVLVFISEVFLKKNYDAEEHFTLIFPDMYIFTVFFSVILMNYIFQDGKSDYFQGSILLIIYAIMCGILLI